MRALITGAGGQLGIELLKTAPKDSDVIALRHSDLDITDTKAVDAAMQHHRPDVVVNAAAYNAVDEAEHHPDLAYAANRTGPRNLAAAAERGRARIIHVSTDYVFDGKSDQPYQTTDTPNPINAYGQSKLAGEQEVERLAANHLVIRTSWLFSAQGRNFLQIVLGALREAKPVRAVNDQMSVPTACRSLAEVIWLCTPLDAPQGIAHWVDAGRATRYDQAIAIRQMALERGLISSAEPVESIPTSALKPAAVRPRFTVLDANQLSRQLGKPQRRWKENLADVLDEIYLKQPVAPGRGN